MLFRRLFLCALFVGVLVGLFDSAVQRWRVVPLIFAAEVFESALDAPAADHAHAAGAAAHSHDAAAWEPQAGFERTAYTVLANVLNATGLALLLLPLVAFVNRQRAGLALQKSRGALVGQGLLWGAAIWLCLFGLPALGQAPVLPGVQAAPLQARQLWWALTAASSAGGLAVLCFVPSLWRVLGLALLALPFAVGAPHAEGSAFAGMSAEVAPQMQALAAQFVVATSVASALQCLLLGALCALLAARWINPLLSRDVKKNTQPTAIAGSTL